MRSRYSYRLEIADDPLWYRTAIIYELHIRAFADFDGDGIGDFQGLIGKLDYLEELGITAIWLLPFYPSPLKDDGYDISDYFNIQPEYGTMTDFRRLVEEAHRRNIRIITELVLNHTSDRHPWFQRARRASPESRYRNFYVWSDTPDKYREARIIFKDYESSNWTLDPVAKAYYWHRFYHHQPDLNYDNPALVKAIYRTVDFWLKLGVDGLRVDAVPYLYEREGTNCENLDETHQFVRELRTHIDSKFSNRMLLAEANQWPEDAAAYFGNGDEFQMAFHFPIMPRLFMALRMEDRFPIIDILQQTPHIPDTCQWALFLRNHDELTLEMVTDEERDYMYRVYAADPSTRLNLGIRRRLAPLLSNDRKKIELLNSLLFSLPGTPVLYYGDEIGMGDNFYLGDRNGVRTPMQWSPERNAGFSRANTQRLYLPLIVDPEYHYEAVNVENQLNNPDSLLWWMKRIIALRKRYQAFGAGSIEFLYSENRKTLSYLRRSTNETILIIANLSHLPQQTSLDLHEYAGLKPVDLFGRVEFSPVTENRYSFTLGPYGFYWFSLEETKPLALSGEREPGKATVMPEMTVALSTLLEKKEKWYIIEPVVGRYLQARRWFRGKARRPLSVTIKETVPVTFDRKTVFITMIQVNYTEGEPETYLIPITELSENYEKLTEEFPMCVIARHINTEGQIAGIFVDALYNEPFCHFLLNAIKGHRIFRGTGGEIVASPTSLFRSLVSRTNATLNPAPVKGEQSNTSVIYGTTLIFKLFRHIEEGVNPDVEMSTFLTQNTGFRNISRICGSIDYRQSRKKTASLAILQQYIENEGDAWHYTLDFLERYFSTVMAHPTVQIPAVPQKSLLSLVKDPPDLARETIGPYLLSAQQLGQRTAELHLALASPADNPDFTPEPFTYLYRISLYQSLRSFARRVMLLLRERLPYLMPELAEEARTLLGQEKNIVKRYEAIRTQKITALRIRCHGDYHLGQVLYTGRDFVIIDFEGEPARPLGERRLKRSALTDVAGMIRSFHYASHSAVNKEATIIPAPEDNLPVLRQWAQYWYTWVSAAFLNSYLATAGHSGLVPEQPEQTELLLDALLLDKALYEIAYELNNRPEWVNVPFQGIQQLLSAII